ncbi:MAG TPA: SDR family oxidoreductase [Candidatus Binatia bacterium]
MQTLDDLFSLRGKVALVTGASAGIGVELARALAIAGADVALVARRRERLEALASELRAGGVRAEPIAADLASDADVERIVPECEERLGPVDILVNNAGIALIGRSERFPRDKWDTTLRVDLTAAWLLCQQVGRRMIERGSGGRIVNVTSVISAGANPIYHGPAYSAAKAALLNVTRQLAVEWAQYGITVNALAPGWFTTEMTAEGFTQERFRSKAETLTPMGRIGEPHELRSALLFLTAPSSTFVTGTTVFVDGGWTAW